MTASDPTPRDQPGPSSYTPAPQARYVVGDRVRIRRTFPPGHRRTPYYIRGKVGSIERICGAFPNPEELAYGFDGEPEHTLYRVRFDQSHVWSDYGGTARDLLEIEIYEHWLERDPAPADPVGPDRSE